MQDPCTDKGQEEVNAGSGRCVGRTSGCTPSKSNAKTTGDLTRLGNSGQCRRKFLRTFEAQTHQGRRQRVRGGESCKSARAVPPGGTPAAPGQEGQTKSLAGKWHQVPRGARMERWGEERLRGAELRREAGPRRGSCEGKGWPAARHRRGPGRCEEAGARAGPGGRPRGSPAAPAGKGGGRGAGGCPFPLRLPRRRGSRRHRVGGRP